MLKALRQKSVLLSSLAFCIEGLAFSSYFKVGELLETWSTKMAGSLSATSWSPVESHYFSLVTVGFLFVPVLYVSTRITLTAAERIRKMARRASLRSAEEVVKEDQRAPVLFLRGFDDDQVSLSYAGMPAYARIADPGFDYANLEDVLEVALNIGPIVAIGRPREIAPPIGAARQYVDDDAWKNVVISLMNQAALIVVGVSNSQGLMWEIEQLRQLSHLGKSVFIIPPRHRWNRRLVHELLLKLLAVSDAFESNRLAAELEGKIGERQIVGFSVTQQIVNVFATYKKLSPVEFDATLRLAIVAAQDYGILAAPSPNVTVRGNHELRGGCNFRLS